MKSTLKLIGIPIIYYFLYTYIAVYNHLNDITFFVFVDGTLFLVLPKQPWVHFFTMVFIFLYFSISITYFYQLMANVCFLSSSHNKTCTNIFLQLLKCLHFAYLFWAIPAILACQWQFCASSTHTWQNVINKNHTHEKISLKDQNYNNNNNK